MIITLLTFLGGQELMVLLLVIPVILFFVVRSIRKNAAMKAENRILKSKIDSSALEELGKLRQSGILTEEEFQKKKNEILNP